MFITEKMFMGETIYYPDCDFRHFFSVMKIFRYDLIGYEFSVKNISVMNGEVSIVATNLLGI